MATITFDTLKFVEKLRVAGVPEAEAEALQGFFAETLETQLATKTDIVRLERRLDGFDAKIDRLETNLSGELTLVKWMMGLILGGVIALIMRVFFPA